MSFKDCIDKALKDGNIKPERADEAKRIYDDEVARYIRSGDTESQAANKASMSAVEKVTTLKGEKKYAKLKQIEAEYRLYKDLGESTGKLEQNVFGPIEGGFGWKGTNVVSRYKTRLGEYHSILADFIDEARPKAHTLYLKVKSLDNVLREMAGESTGDSSAKELAGIMKKANDLIIKRANEAGASIGKDPLWWFPQRHDQRTLNKVSAEKWISDHMGWLDWDRMKWPDGREILPNERIEYLTNAHNTLKTGGFNKKNLGVRGENIASRMAHERKLFYKDAGSWLAAHKKYGSGTIFDNYISWVDEMARNTALMDVFGPNPTAARAKFMGDIKNIAAGIDAGKDIVKGKSKVSKVKDAAIRADEAWDLYLLGNKASDENYFANTMGSVRAFFGASALSGSALPAFLGDTANAERVLMFNKLPAIKYMQNYLGAATTKSGKRDAVRSGLVAEYASQRMSASQRVFGADHAFKWAKYLNDTTLRITGLAPHTQIAKWSVGTSIMGGFADDIKKPFDKLPYKSLLERNGITANDWDILRKNTKIYDEGGLHILRPNDLRDSGIDSETAKIVADKFMDMVFNSTRDAIIESSYRTRSLLVSKSAAGTVSGEVLRSFAHLKSFSVAMTIALANELAAKKTLPGKFGNLASFFVVMSIYGAATLQAQQIASGKDPLNMNDIKFWGAAMLKGAALGAFGDFIYSAINNKGKGLQEMVAGPSVELIGDVSKLTVGNAIELAQGKETNFGAEATKFGMDVLPGKNFPVWKLLFERYVSDQLLLLTDENAYKKLKAKETRARKDFDQEYWWRPGEKEPSRSVDFGAAWQSDD